MDCRKPFLKMENKYKKIWNLYKDCEFESANLDNWFKGRSVFLLVAKIENNKFLEEVHKFNNKLRTYDFIDFFPDYYYHITLKLIGFHNDGKKKDDEVSSEDLERITRELKENLKLFKPFEIKLGLLNRFPNTVFIEPKDNNLLKIHKMIVNNIKMPKFPYDGENFIPHISLLEFNKTVINKDLIEFIETNRSFFKNIDVKIKKLILIKMTYPKDKSLMFEEIAEFEIK